MADKPLRVLVLGATGMLGNATLRLFANSPGFEVFGSVRSEGSIRLLANDLRERIIYGVDVENADSVTRLFALARPDLVINCVGLVKQLANADDVLSAIPINTMLPHRLVHLCSVAGARLVHVSTDCVFSGLKGMYKEADLPDATDLYGRSKYLGEVDYPNVVTLRTSIIGHELNSANSLVGWFLAQEGAVKGYKRAIFSGLPTVEVACLIRDHVIPYPELHGVYHVSSDPISKFDLLKMVAERYKKTIEIQADDQLVIDRSLDSTRFRIATKYRPKPWIDLVRAMYEFR